MSNVLDPSPIHLCARRAASKIGDAKIATRFEKLAYARLYKDERNFRRARPDEIETAPAYIQSAVKRGDAIHVFRPCQSAVRRLHTVASRLDVACKLAAAIAVDASDGGPIADARAFLDKIDRADFDTLARKALHHARIYVHWLEVREHVCPPGEVRATNGRIWRRVTSLAQLQAVGCAFGNCLARTGAKSAYGSTLVEGSAQFWVLRDANEAGRMIAMASTRAPIDFREVKGTRNTPVSRTDPDLVLLAQVILTPPENPPTPTPPTAGALINQHFPRNIPLEDIVCAPLGLDMMPLGMHLVSLPARPRLKSRKAS